MDERGRKDSRRPSFTADLDDLALLEGTVAEDLDGGCPQPEVMQAATAANPVSWRTCQKRASDNRTTVCRPRMGDAGVDFDPPPDLTDQDIDCEILCEVEPDEAQGLGMPDNAERTTQTLMLAGPRRSAGLFSQVMARSSANGRMTFSHADDGDRLTSGRLTSGHLPGRSTYQDRRSFNDVAMPDWKNIRSQAEVAAASDLQPGYMDPLMHEFDALPLVARDHFAGAACSSVEVASSSVADVSVDMPKGKDVETMQRMDTIDSAGPGFSDLNTQSQGRASATSRSCDVGSAVPSGAALALQWEAALARAEAAERRADEAEQRAMAAERRLAELESYALPSCQPSACSSEVDASFVDRRYSAPSPASCSSGPRPPAGPKPPQNFMRKGVVSNDASLRPASATEEGTRHSKGDKDDGDISHSSSGRAKGQSDRRTPGSSHSSESLHAFGSGRHAAQWLSPPKTQ